MQNHERTPRWRRSVWAQLAVLFLIFGVVMALGNGLTSALAGSVIGALLLGPVVAVAAIWLYRRVSPVVEGRPDVTELDLSAARSGLSRGILLGLGLFAATMAVIAIFGGFKTVGWGSLGGLLVALGVNACAAVTEEILFRGVLFRLVDQALGTRIALVGSAAVFGLLHLVNPHATLWGAIAIAIEAGLMLGAAYTVSRSLWLPIGVHFGWNLAEGGLFGVTVSGSDDNGGLLHTALSGSSALTGGSFGPEASVVAILVCTLATWYFLRVARRRTASRPGAPATAQ